MKNFAQFFLVAIMAISVMACQKENESIQSDAYEAAQEMQYLLEGIEASEDESLGDFLTSSQLEARSKCVEISAAEPKGTYPNTITFTFDNCEGPNGHIRNGVIVVTLSGPMKEAGSVKSTTFENFFIDDVQVVGTKTVTNEGLNDQGQLVLTRNASLEFLFEGEVKRTWNASHTMTLIKGGDTEPRWDDVWAISGSASSSHAEKGEFSVTILEDLIKPNNCRWIVAGVKEVNKNGEVFIIDYGDGKCDRLAEVTLPDGTVKEIRLGRRR